MFKYARKQKKILILSIYLLAASFLIFGLGSSYLKILIILYIVPAALTFSWLRNSHQKILVFAVLTTLLISIPLELVANINGAWHINSAYTLLFERVAKENILFWFVNIFWILSFYEYFSDKDAGNRVGKRSSILFFGYGLISLLIYTLFIFQKDMLLFDAWIVGLYFTLIPSGLILLQNPSLALKLVLPVLFFSIVFLVFQFWVISGEIWIWQGDYLYGVDTVGGNIPVDSLIVWGFVLPIAIITAYEYFVDNNR